MMSPPRKIRLSSPPRHGLWLTVLIGAMGAGCADTTPSKPSAPRSSSSLSPAPTPTVTVSPAVGTSDAPPTASAATPTPKTEVPTDVLVGKVKLNSKGHRPTVAGRILDPQAFQAQFGDGWRKLVDKKRVRAVGHDIAYKCKPMEQCLIGGYIYSFRDIQSITLCDEAAPNGQNAQCPAADTPFPAPPTASPIP